MSKRRDHRAVRTPRPDSDERSLRDAIGRMDGRGFQWDDIRDDIMPIFERARPYAGQLDPPARAVGPPGVTLGLGVGVGVAFGRLSVVHLAEWPVELPPLTDRALRNLRKRARHPTDYDLV